MNKSHNNKENPSKQIPSFTRALLRRIGTKLSGRRTELNMSSQTITDKLKIQTNHIKALEDGILEDLPSIPFLFASLRSYASFLGLNADELIDDCKRDPFLFSGLHLGARIYTGENQKYIEILERQKVEAKPSSLQKLETSPQTKQSQQKPSVQELYPGNKAPNDSSARDSTKAHLRSLGVVIIFILMTLCFDFMYYWSSDNLKGLKQKIEYNSSDY